MKGFWNKLGDKYLSKVQIGTLIVSYSNGIEKVYGNGEVPSIKVKIPLALLGLEIWFFFPSSCFLRRYRIC